MFSNLSIYICKSNRQLNSIQNGHCCREYVMTKMCTFSHKCDYDGRMQLKIKMKENIHNYTPFRVLILIEKE